MAVRPSRRLRHGGMIKAWQPLCRLGHGGMPNKACRPGVMASSIAGDLPIAACRIGESWLLASRRARISHHQTPCAPSSRVPPLLLFLHVLSAFLGPPHLGLLSWQDISFSRRFAKKECEQLCVTCCETMNYQLSYSILVSPTCLLLVSSMHWFSFLSMLYLDTSNSNVNQRLLSIRHMHLTYSWNFPILIQ